MSKGCILVWIFEYMDICGYIMDIFDVCELLDIKYAKLLHLGVDI